jgi:hypothetical protein
MVSAMSAWDVRTALPTDKPGVMFRLYLPDMRRYLSHTTSERVDREKLEIKAFHYVCFASWMTRWALEVKRLKDIKFSKVAWAWKCVKARRRERIESRHSSVHHGTGVRRRADEDRRIRCAAARSILLVKYPAIESIDRKPWCSKAKTERNQHSRYVWLLTLGEFTRLGMWKFTG